jgi:hypothetical protein
MGRDLFRTAFVLAASFCLLDLTSTAHVLQTIPLTVEDVRILAPTREGLPPDVAITVRNTGTRVIEAWGVAGEVRYANGVTKRIGATTDAYEMTSFPESMRPPAELNTRLPPDGRATLKTSTPTVALAAPTDAAAFPTFVVFDDDTAAGEEAMIEFVFSRRQLAQRVWRVAHQTWTAAVAQGLKPEQTGASILAALEAAGDEVTQSIPFSIVRRTLSSSSPERFERLRLQIESRLAAADRHAQRRR